MRAEPTVVAKLISVADEVSQIELNVQVDEQAKVAAHVAPCTVGLWGVLPPPAAFIGSEYPWLVAKCLERRAEAIQAIVGI